MKKRSLFALPLLAASTYAAVTATETVTLPSTAAWGSGLSIISQLIGRTYNAGYGPGIWIVADGGYRLYLNGELLAQDNQAGRVTFVPMTFLPGANAVSVVGVDGNGAPGVLVQIDELQTSHVSGTAWKVATSVADNSWMKSSYSDAAWTAATVHSTATATTSPSGATLSGFAAGSSAKWIWASSTSTKQAVLRYTFNIKAEGYGAATTGGAAGSTVVASTVAEIKAALQSSSATTILVPEGTYDFRNTRDDANGTYKWCTRKCASTDCNSSNTYYRITFDGTCPTGETIATSVSRWDNWITTRANKSLIGMGRGANLRGASLYMRGAESASNNIFRNLAIYDVNPHLVEGNDGLSAVNSSKLWIDHVSYKWISDGLDIEQTKEVTISYTEIDGSNNKNCQGNDPYVALVANSDVTYGNNYFRNTMGRVPKVTSSSYASKVHMYNNYVDSNTYFVVGAGGSSSTYQSQVLLENNYLNNAKGYPTMKDPYGYIKSTGNTWAGTTGSHQVVNSSGTRTAAAEPTDAVFTPSYSYSKRTVSTLPSQIMAYAGVGGKWGTMPTYTQSAGKSNNAPTVTMSTPSVSGTTVTLTATASDADGSIAKVEFYMGTTLVGTDNASPYTVTVSSVGAGTHSIVAKATDNSGLVNNSAFVSATVSTGAAPVIGAATAFSVVENASKFITNVAATDANGDALTYTIDGGDDLALFLIGTTGNLYFSKLPNYEAPLDADANNTYKLRVKVTDATGLYTQKSLTVTVTNVNEAPAFSSAAAKTVNENVSKYVMAIVASDPENNTLTYTVSGGDDQAQFIMNSSTGALYLIRIPDYESPRDLDLNNTYKVRVRATDPSGLYVDQSLVVTVANVTETSVAARIAASAYNNADAQWPADSAAWVASVGPIGDAGTTSMRNAAENSAINSQGIVKVYDLRGRKVYQGQQQPSNLSRQNRIILE